MERNPSDNAIHGSYCIALLDAMDPENGQPITMEFIEKHMQHDPQMLAIAKRIGERVLPLAMNPFITEGRGDFGDASVWLHIPEDDHEAVEYYDGIVARAKAAQAARIAKARLQQEL